MDRVKATLGHVGSFRLSPDDKTRLMKDTAWVDGLRGIAAVLVVSSHVVLCYARGLIPPCCAAGSNSPYLFQRPILRLISSGHSWLAMFFILMGFVNGLKPLQLARAGQTDKALNKLSSSSFSRICRLVLPATATTIINWLICNLGLYRTALLSNAYWLYTTSPRPSESWPQAFHHLLSGLEGTWLLGWENVYDQPQWALVYLLQGSFMIITALFLVMPMTPLWRTTTLLILAYWSLNWSQMLGDPWTGLCCFAGVMLSELSLSNIPHRAANISVYLSPPIIMVALILMSYPGSFHETASWSSWLYDMGVRYLPDVTVDALDRTYGSLGGILLILGILVSPHARWVCSRRPLLWLGKVSYAIYLLHGLMMRTVFAWVLHLGQPLEVFHQHGDDGSDYHFQRYPVPGFGQCALATVVLAVCLGVASQVWRVKMEPMFAKLAARLEGLVMGKSCAVVDCEKSLLPTRND